LETGRHAKTKQPRRMMQPTVRSPPATQTRAINTVAGETAEKRRRSRRMWERRVSVRVTTNAHAATRIYWSDVSHGNRPGSSTHDKKCGSGVECEYLFEGSDCQQTQLGEMTTESSVIQAISTPLVRCRVENHGHCSQRMVVSVMKENICSVSHSDRAIMCPHPPRRVPS
jgi:hypothetical protein